MHALHGTRPHLQHLQGGGVHAVGGADVKLLRGPEAEAAVISRVAVDDDGTVAHLPAQRERMAHQRRARAHALIDRQHAQRAKGDGGYVLDARAAVKDAGGDLRAVGGHEIQLGQKVLVRAQLVDEVMFLAAGRIEVPESLAGQFLHGAEVLFRFPAYLKAHRTLPPLLSHYTPIFAKRKERGGKRALSAPPAPALTSAWT